MDKAEALVLAGRVLSGSRRLDSAGESFSIGIPLTVKSRRAHPFVSRGGVKLAGALDACGVDPSGKVCLDLGAGAGGFTDCLLQRGAVRVFAVDVAYGALDERLRRDPRVVTLERTHADALNRSLIPDSVALLTADISFNSLIRILPPALELLADGAEGLLLVKPQFEAPRDQVSRGGVVHNEAVRVAAVKRVCDFLCEKRMEVVTTVPSSVKLQSGNREFFIFMRNPAPETRALHSARD